MSQRLILKWGNVKGWNGFAAGTPARAALERWAESGQGMSAMQRQTPEQRELICAIIDAVNGEIFNDLDDIAMSKEDAKHYVRNYSLGSQ